MIKNRISKYFRTPADVEPRPEPPRVKPSAFIAMPNSTGPAAAGPQMPRSTMPQPPMSIYDIALNDAKRKIAEARENQADDLDDLSGWFDSSF